jgi:threonine synthase
MFKIIILLKKIQKHKKSIKMFKNLKIKILNMLEPVAYQKCIMPDCGATYSVKEVLTSCKRCGNLLDVVYDWSRINVPKDLRAFSARIGNASNIADMSGVWRFRELLPFISYHDPYAYLQEIVSLDGMEGWTRPIHVSTAADYTGMSRKTLYVQFEGQNPTGSFKDNGMTAAFTHAQMVGAKKAACASTGNTSASFAAYAANSGFLEAFVFIGEGKIAYGKLSQSLEFGAKTIQIEGDFDDAMARVQELAKEKGIYLVNSVNPFRLEGQKTIMYRVLEGLDWRVPDWIVCPGGNLGNSSAFGKAFEELYNLGLINKKPRLAIVNAEGANTLYRLYNEKKLRWNGGKVDFKIIKNFYDEMDKEKRKAHTIASAIEINKPVNLLKALRSLEWTDGVVVEVSDQEILDAKAVIGKNGMFGCEPASAASVAGVKKLVEDKTIEPDSIVVAILTGNQLKDPDAIVGYHAQGFNSALDEKFNNYKIVSRRFQNKPVKVKNDLKKIIEVMGI